MMDFKYEIKIMADPEEVFAALTNPFQIELWSGYAADMKAEVGYVFSLWEGVLQVSTWKLYRTGFWCRNGFFGENAEPSIVRLELKKDGNRGTVVRLLHTHIPAEVFEEITEGWKEYYLGSVKNMLEVY